MILISNFVNLRKLYISNLIFKLKLISLNTEKQLILKESISLFITYAPIFIEAD